MRMLLALFPHNGLHPHGCYAAASRPGANQESDAKKRGRWKIDRPRFYKQNMPLVREKESAPGLLPVGFSSSKKPSDTSKPSSRALSAASTA